MNHASTSTTSGLPVNTVLHGDCIQVMQDLPLASVDFILTDPPYLANYRARDGRRVANDDNADWLRPAFGQMHRLLKDSAFCVSFYGWHKVDLFMAAWRAAGFRTVGHIVFRKRYASSTRFMRCHHEQKNCNPAQTSLYIAGCGVFFAKVYEMFYTARPWWASL